MNKKVLFKYVLMYIPFLVGVLTYCYNIINLFSSLLLFAGGYIAVKNTFDYRMVRRNIGIEKINNDVRKEEGIKVKNYESVSLKRVRRNFKIRKRIK